MYLLYLQVKKYYLSGAKIFSLVYINVTVSDAKLKISLNIIIFQHFIL